MVTFEQRWNQIEQTLKAAAGEMRIPVENVRKGAFETGLPMSPPFLYIGLIPGDMIPSESGQPMARGFQATCEIFCAVGAKGSNAEAIIAAHDMALAALSVIRASGLQIRLPQSPITIDTVTPQLTAANLQFTVQYLV